MPLSVQVHVRQLVIDSEEPERVARFWVALLSGTVDVRDPAWVVVELGAPLRLAFQRVPESKSIKNRLHLDLQVPSVGAAADAAVLLGATIVRTDHDEAGPYVVMQDVEGNEFCFVEVPAPG